VDLGRKGHLIPDDALGMAMMVAQMLLGSTVS
jgi:hypothetical protein